MIQTKNPTNQVDEFDEDDVDPVPVPVKNTVVEP
jgi:hypothetical protein